MNRDFFHQSIGRVEEIIDVPVGLLSFSYVTRNAPSQASHGAAGIEVGAGGKKSLAQPAHADRSLFRENDD